MRRRYLFLLPSCFLLGAPIPLARAQALAPSSVTFKAKPQSSERQRDFIYKDRSGKVATIPVVETYHPGRIVYPLGKVDPRLDKRLIHAASIAQERSHAHSKSRCWHYVKEALFAAGAVATRPKTALAKQAGDELVQSFGFKKLAIRDPYKAPVGAVLVYGARRAAGHVEIRTPTGFVSDFRNKKPSRRPLIGVYAKA